MPRPTIAQAAYGSLTVVLSTFAMLLLSQARSGPGVVLIAAAGLILGLLVALAVALQNRRASAGPASAAVPVSVSVPSSVSLPRARVRVRGASAEPRVGEHSLRR